MYDQDDDVSEFQFDPTASLRRLEALAIRRDQLRLALAAVEVEGDCLRRALIPVSTVSREVEDHAGA
jgi:hypothetical protein